MKKLIIVFVFLFVVMGTVNADPLSVEADTIALWHMEEGSGIYINDSTGNHNGTFPAAPGDPSFNSSVRKYGSYAIYFENADGQYDYIAVPNAHDLNLLGNYTIEAWVNVDNFAVIRGVLSKITVANGWGIYIGTDKTVRVWINNIGRSSHVSNGTIETGTWHNIGVSYKKDTQNLTLYIDYVPVMEWHSVPSPTATSGPLQIGKNEGDFFYGNLDEIRLSNVSIDVRASFTIDDFNTPTEATETETINYWLDLDIDWSIIENFTVSLIVNGTPYNTVYDSDYNFSVDVEMPEVNELTELVTSWNYTTCFIAGGCDSFILFAQNITVNTFGVYDCLSGNESIVIRGYNESEPYTLEYFDLELMINFTSLSRDFNFTLSGNNTYKICLNDSSDSFIIREAILEYKNTSSDLRRYYLNSFNMDNTTAYIDLYMLDSYLSIQKTFTVKSIYGILEEDVIIKMQRFYVGENQYRTFAMIKTDVDGEGSTYIQDDIWIKFILERHGVVLRVYDPVVFSENSLTLYTTTDETIPLFEYYDTIAHSCTFTNSSGLLVCTVSDTSGHSQVFGLVANKYDTMSTTTICDETSTSSATTLICDLSDHMNNGTIEYYLYGDFNSVTSTYIIKKEALSFEAAITFGLIGVLVAMLLFITAFFAGIWNPVVAIGLCCFSLLFSSVVGLLAVELSAVFSIIAVGALIAYKIKV